MSYSINLFILYRSRTNIFCMGSEVKPMQINKYIDLNLTKIHVKPIKNCHVSIWHINFLFFIFKKGKKNH
jgi:hypothetical protein